MSYIYEALKRAEDEREHGAVTVRTVARPLFFAARARWWVWALIGALAVNAGLLVVLAVDRWWRPPTAAAPVAAVVVAPRVETAPPPPIARETPAPVVTAPRVEPRREVAAPAPGVVEPERPQPAPRPTPEPQPLAVTPAPVEPRTSIAPPPPATPEPRVPPTPVESAPDLKLQVHVYSLVASERMVFIAGRRYAEGDAIDADTVLEKITPDGAVVRLRGQRFELSGRRP